MNRSLPYLIVGTIVTTIVPGARLMRRSAQADCAKYGGKNCEVLIAKCSQ